MSFPKWILVLLFGLILSSCMARTQNLIGDNQRMMKALSNEKSIVIGEINWKTNSEKVSNKITPNLLRLNDKKRFECVLNERGEFTWALEPGAYVFNKINYWDNWSGNYFFVPQVGFLIPEGKKVYYVGTLDVDFKAKRDWIGGISGSAIFKVVDNSSGQMITDFKDNYDGAPEDLEKSLMIRRSDFPRTFDTTSEFNIGLQILNAIMQVPM